MNGSSKARTTRTIKVSPTTRAIRSALAVSATVLALSGSGVALAGTCAVSALQTVSCDGDFNTTITYPDVDLTLIVGANAPSTVTPAAGNIGIDASWSGNNTVINYADITTDGIEGVHQYSVDGTTTLHNYGDITTDVSVAYANAIDAAAYGDVTIVNGGSVLAYSGGAYDVTTVYAYSSNGSVSINNQVGGNIAANAYDGMAFAVSGYGQYGMDVTNDGDIHASSFNDQAYGVDAGAKYGDTNVTNSGTIEAYSLSSNSTGVYGFSYEGDVTIDNSGSITVGGAGYATGVTAFAPFAGAYVYNSGDISTTSYDARALGVTASGKYAYVNNSGSIDAYGYTNAGGIDVYGTYGVSVVTTGDINVTAVGAGGTAAGIDSYTHGSTYIYNNGNINVSATGTGGVALAYSEGADAVGISAVSVYSEGGNNNALLGGANDVNIVNGPYGVINVYAAGNGTGIYAATFGLGSVYVSNEGSIDVYAAGNAFGVRAYTDTVGGDVYVYNSGSISVESYNNDAYGIYVDTQNENLVTVDNSGSIDAYSTREDSYGVVVWANDGGATITNSGDITSGSYDGRASGIYVYVNSNNPAYSADVSIYNSGSVSASTVYGIARGIGAGTEYQGSIDITNAGSVSASSIYDTAYGLYAWGDGNSYGSFTLTNTADGTINAYSEYDSAIGIFAEARYDNTVTIDNAGSIIATTGTYDAVDGYGVKVLAYDSYAASNYSDVYVTNSGSIQAYGYDDAWGVYVWNDEGYVSVLNSGSIDAVAGTDYASGISVFATGSSDIYVGNDTTGSISAIGYEEGYGIAVFAAYGNVTVANAGSIYAAGGSDGIGIYVQNDEGDVSITNDGSIDAVGPDFAAGIWSNAALGYVTVTNGAYGAISATSGVSAFGVYVDAYFDSDVYNHGDIAAVASNASGYNTQAVGIVSAAEFGDSYVYNGGSVSATADGGDFSGALGAGAQSRYYDATLVNAGSISADAAGDIFASATGALALGEDSAYAVNDGDISASAIGGVYAEAGGVLLASDGVAEFFSGVGSSVDAYAAAYDTATANGVAAYGSYVLTYSEGAISATAVADDYYGSAYATGLRLESDTAYATMSADSAISADASGYFASATGVQVFADYTGFDNAGSIAATATAYTGFAIGADVRSNNAITMYNSGSISAESSVVYGGAQGVFAYSYNNDVAVINSGDISASSDGFAYAVSIGSNTSGFVYNSGTIEADGGKYSVAIRSFGSSSDYINNEGTITGAIWTGYGVDYLHNQEGGTWNAIESSYFGEDDDSIVNDGTINMTDALIDLGTYSVYGNEFVNNGTITVSGTNEIDMGGPMALVPSLNPYAFYNYGVIDFQDGAPDDVLTIVGDFAGDGAINVDVSGLSEASDLLYIDGSVVDGTVNTVNVDFVDLPTTASIEIPVIYVSGNSVDSNFELGSVSYTQNNFLTLGFSLLSDIDDTNAVNDVFYLGVDVTGLSDPGTLAAAIAPGAQSLANSQVGTWRQRMGVIEKYGKGEWSLWGRVFQDKGDIDPDHVATNFGQGGNFGFEQKNSGAEVGVDVGVSEEFSLGLLLAKSEASQHLNGAGVGSSKIKGDTWGVYGTWIAPNGFYLDASYRWMSFDVTMNSIAGEKKVSGDADTFNIELGYAWTLSSGWKVEPQFQYTKTQVDNIDLVQGDLADFDAQGGDSSRGRLGVMFRKSFAPTAGGTVWTPYASINAVREFDGKNSYAVNGDFFGYTSTEGTSALVEVGFNAKTGNLSVYGGLNWQDGGALNSFLGGQLGVRYTFGHAAPAVVPTPAPVVEKTCADLDDDGDGVNNCNDKCPASTAGQAVGPDGCPVPLTIDLKGVNFDFDKATLRPDATAILDEAVAILAKYPELKVEVAGHTDAIGTEPYNQGLSERRAQAVYDYLASHGVDAGRMMGPTGYGETRPIAPNTNEDGSDNPEGRAKNRRTELDVQN